MGWGLGGTKYILDPSEIGQGEDHNKNNKEGGRRKRWPQLCSRRRR